jgi:hypothetical protein
MTPTQTTTAVTVNIKSLWTAAIKSDDLRFVKNIIRVHGFQSSLERSICTALLHSSELCLAYFKELLLSQEVDSLLRAKGIEQKLSKRKAWNKVKRKLVSHGFSKE